ncbi:unnamed protein product [Blepharisma stoltei]|uniref:Uncharacterized protein n=1 Tax=Blepharisma stoltei TaxID=1481888 RepID=A0AAU9JBX7_9CILI|nr:unnamed protein product [Blepharisma stoltei]
MAIRREYDYLFKLVIIGDSGVGKSCIIVRFADDTFTESYLTTIGVDFRFRTLDIDGTSVKLQIWDTAGQERFRTITTAYYRGSDGLIVVFDKTNRGSFNNVDSWMEEVNRYAHESSVKLLIGNKSDETSAVETSEGERKAQQYGINYVETSAKTAYQVDLAFTTIARELLKKRRESGFQPIPRPKLNLAVKEEKKQPNCC